MRSFVTLGVLSLFGAASLIGCGDDDGNGPSGTGGSAGMGGSSGAAGAAGAAGDGGMAGTGMGGSGQGGSGGQGGTGTAIAPCTDCLELVMPAAEGARALNFQFDFPTALDFSGATITWNLILQPEDANANAFVQTYVANGPPEDPGYLFNNYTNYTTLAATNFPGGELALEHDLVAVPLPGAGDAGPEEPDGGALSDAGDAGVVLTAFDKRYVRSAGIQIGTAEANTSTNDVRVFLDSVTFSGVSGTPTGTFTMDAEGFALNNYQTIPGVTPPIHHD